MKVYIAAPWICKDAASAAAVQFETAGIGITKRWWEHREVPGYLGNEESNAELQQQAEEDIAGVIKADAMVLLNLSKSEGKAVETGIALSFNKPVLLLGGKSNLFHYMPSVIEVPNIAEAILMCLVMNEARIVRSAGFHTSRRSAA